MLIKRILCGEDAILNNVDQSEAELARLGGVAGAPAKGETRAERATTTSCSNANYPYIMLYRKPSPPATLRTSDHPSLPVLPLRLTYLPNSAFQSLLSSQDLTYLYTADDGEGWTHSDRFEANFPIAILDRLLSQVSERDARGTDIASRVGELGAQIRVYEFWK